MAFSDERNKRQLFTGLSLFCVLPFNYRRRWVMSDNSSKIMHLVTKREILDNKIKSIETRIAKKESLLSRNMSERESWITENVIKSLREDVEVIRSQMLEIENQIRELRRAG